MKNRSTKLVARKAVESLRLLLSKFSVCPETRRKSPIHISLLFLFAILSSPVSVTVASDGSLQSNASPLYEEASSISLTREIVFIDSAVEDQSLLIKAVRPDAEVILLSPDVDGVSQIAKSLRDRSDISAIHIVSHGHAGQLLLGTSNLNSNTLSGYLSEINTISAALSKDADILLYGCNVAQGDSGQAFISKFAEMTTADIAASENVTGDAEKGGDWVLENRQGEVQAGVVFSQKGLAGYKQLLAIPEITSTAIISVDEDAGYIYTISATDADLHLLTYSAPTIPDWMSFDPGSRQLTGAPTNDEVGTHSVVLRVSDGTDSVDQDFTITVSNTNDAPLITSTADTTASEDAPYSYTITATDVDGDSLTYSAQTKPSWLNFNTSSHVLSGTPINADVGTHSVKLQVNDGTVDVVQSFTITVSNTNDAPVITSTGDTTALEDAPYSYTLTATDADGDGLSYSAPTKPSWLSFSTSSHKLTGTPTNTDVGNHSVVLRVSDGEDSVEQGFTITVTNTNDAPQITSSEDTTATEDSPYSYTITATDADGDDLTYSAPTKPSWLSFSTITHKLTGTPTNANVGDHSVLLRVSDGTVDVEQNFTITVSNTNDAPVITSVENTTAPEDAAYSYTLVATDADGDSLTYSAQTKPSWLSFSGSTHKLTGTPTNANVGDHSVKLRVSDGTVNVDQSFTITVTNTNDAPVITSNADTAAPEDAPYSYTITATDADGDSLSYSAPTKPSWLSFNTGTRKLTGTPTNANVGNHSVVLRVNDGVVNVDQNFTITVSNTNDGPQITSNADTTAPEDALYSYTFMAIDADGDSLTYSAPTKPSWLSFNTSNHVLSGTPTNANVGDHNVKLRVSDGTISVDQSFTITVSNTNDAPQITSTADTTAPEDAPYSYTIAATDADGDSLSYSAPIKPSWLSFDSGERKLTGTPTNANVGNHSVTLRVSDGTVSVDQNFTITVANVNDVPVITSSGITSAQEDTAYSYTFTATDADAGTILTYSVLTKPSWLNFNVSSHVLSGTPTNANVGTHSVKLRVSDGVVSVDQSFSITVANVNDAPTGKPLIVGAATEKVTLSVDISQINDDDVIASGFTYQWKSGGENVGKKSAYRLRQSDVGKTITVAVTFTDNGGTTETVISDAKGPVVNVNDTATGQPEIVGEAIEDVTLSVNTSNINDVDGGVNGFTYQWKNGGVIVGTSSTYKLLQTDVNKTMTVTVQFTDDGGSLETLVSNATAAVANVNDDPVGIPTIIGSVSKRSVLTADTSHIIDEDGIGAGAFNYQWVRNDNNIAGATLVNYTLVQADVNNTIKVVVTYVDNGGKAETITSLATGLVSNNNAAPLGKPVITGIVEENVTLGVDTSGISDLDGGVDNFTYQWKSDGVDVGTLSTYLLSQTDVGKVITIFVTYVDDGDTTETVISDATVAVVNVNDIPTGQPVIVGDAIENSVLTVDTTSIADIDGLGEFSYQWLRNGFAISILEGGIDSSYTIVQADVAAQLSLVVSYTDGGGLLESVTSLPTVPVVNVNDPPVGLPIIIGSPVQNGVLTVDTLSITDIDGLGVFSYQWLRDGIAIPGAIDLSYTLFQDDVGTFISIVVSYTDGQLTFESVFSETLGPVSNVNDAGIVIIDSTPESGLAIDGELLSAISITDIDGTSTSDFVYQWLRDGIEISGETGDSYRLATIDLRTFISLRVTYTDDLSETEDNEVVISNSIGPIFPDIPKVVPPNEIGPVVSTGWFTFVEIEKTSQATAVDGFDGALIPFSDSNSQFRPGVTGVIWSAIDSADNVGTAIQDVKVIPLVDINKGQISAEGASVQVKVALNGKAISYPVTVPYTVSGTASAIDHTLVGGSVIINEPAAGELPEGLINFSINTDGLAEGTETVVITLGVPSNAVLGLVKQHTVQIVEGNVAPLVSISASQSGVGTMLRVDPNGNEVIVSAVATDVNGDGFGYDWSGTDVSIVNMDVTNKAAFTFDPVNVTPGFYTFHVSVSDAGAPVVATLTLEVLEQTPMLTTKDSDGDGIVDYLDNISASHILQQKQSISNAFLIQTEPGLKLSLGETAFRANNSQSMVTSQDVVDYAFSGVTGIILLDEIENIGGYFDFIVSGLPIAGQSVQIVLPQLAPLPKLPVYRKLTPSGWKDFVEDEKNAIHSAAGSEGYCLPPGDAAYQPGLSEGRLCVQLTIEDGGPNDLDGLVNNSVTDPGGVSRFLASVSVKSSGGGGGATNPLSLLSVFFMLLYYRNGKHLVRKVA